MQTFILKKSAMKENIYISSNYWLGLRKSQVHDPTSLRRIKIVNPRSLSASQNSYLLVIIYLTINLKRIYTYVFVGDVGVGWLEQGKRNKREDCRKLANLRERNFWMIRNTAYHF